MKTWTKFEKIWVFTFLFLIVGATIYFSATGTDWNSWHSILLNWVISPISAITGIFCVVLAAKGKISTYTWGVINCITYGYVAYFGGYYGDAIINIFYFLPFQAIGLWYWKKHLKKQSKEDVKMRKLSWKVITLIVVLGIIASLLIGLGLFKIDHWLVNDMKRNVSIYEYIDGVTGIKYLGSVLDSSTEVTQIIGQILMTICYAEQWILWIATDIISIFMWALVIIAEPSSYTWAIPTVIMWLAWLINAIYGYVNWLKGAKANEPF